MVRGTSWYENLPEDHQDYTKKNLAALRNYRFEGIYRNKILLLRSDHGAHPLRCIQGKDYGWGRITGARVDVVYVPRMASLYDGEPERRAYCKCSAVGTQRLPIEPLAGNIAQTVDEADDGIRDGGMTRNLQP